MIDSRQVFLPPRYEYLARVYTTSSRRSTPWTENSTSIIGVYQVPTFTPPQFNLLCNIWVGGSSKPSTDSPDLVNYPCQKYVNPKPHANYGNTSSIEFRSPLQLRLKLDPSLGLNDDWTGWGLSYFEVPAGSVRYYRCWFADIAHEGFPNQYIRADVLQCYSNGTPFWQPTATLTFPTSGLYIYMGW